MPERVLLVKTSSLGDLVHTLPALSEASAQRPEVRFDWLVEEAFAALPELHPAVDRVIPVALRRWRRTPGRPACWREAAAFRRELRARHYDVVIDAQGLIKSAVLADMARGPVAGMDRASAREPLAALGYRQRVAVPREAHAIDRLRRLLGVVLGYEPGPSPPRVDLDLPGSTPREAVLLLHGTTWASKHWPEAHWQALIARLCSRGLRVLLPWGDSVELQRARRLAASAPDAEVLPALALDELAGLLRSVRLVVGVDSGLTHLAAVLGTPVVGLFGSTSVALTGLRGPHASSLQAEFPCAPCLARQCRYAGPVHRLEGAVIEPPCHSTLTPARVMRELDALLCESTA